MKCGCCHYPLADCACDDYSPPPCARCYHCHRHCKCGAKYIEATAEACEKAAEIAARAHVKEGEQP